MGKKLTLQTILKFFFIAVLLTVVIMFARSCSEMFEPYVFSENIELIQLEEPNPTQEVAILDTTLGEIRMMLFREECPNTVENFVTLANDGYYDGTFFFACEPGVYAMAGSANRDGSGARTLNDRRIANEYNDNLWPFKGSVMSIGDRNGYSDSRFFFAWDAGIDEELYSSMLENGYPESVAKAFLENGGVPALKGTTKTNGYTVFAQVYEGLDIVESYTNVKTAGENGEPADELKINSVRIMTYEESLEIKDETEG